MTLTTPFTMEVELPPVVNAMGELEDQDPATREYTAHWVVVPAENGGGVSPDHPAYPEVVRVVDNATKEETEDHAVLDFANDVVNAAFNVGDHEAPWGDDYDIGDYGPND